MSKRAKQAAGLIITAFILAFVPGVADEETIADDGNNSKLTLVEKITVSIEKTTLYPGESTRAAYQVSPAEADAKIAWSSSDESLARVSKDGTIKIPQDAKVASGGEYVDIWAKAKDGSLAMNCETICVLPGVTSVKLFMGDTTVYEDDGAPFMSVYVDIQPQSLFGETPIKWQSSDANVAAVKPQGSMGEAAIISWSRPGEATIKVYSAQNPKCSDTLILTVLPAKE